MKRISVKYRIAKAAFFIVLLIAGFLIYVLYFLPLPDSIVTFRSAETTKIYDRNGILLYEILRPEEGRRTALKFEQFPKSLINATLAAEDANYYSHWGVDAGAIIRAIWLNVKNEEITSGGSTITQQFVRNFLGTTRERNISNKLLESLYALRLNQITSKDEILERYLNTVYYGSISYGAEAAALNYFGKHIYDLDIAETALVAGIPQNPTLYNPLTHLDESKERQQEVLERMVKNGFLTQEEATNAQKEKLSFATGNRNKKAPHFVDYILDDLAQQLGKEKLLYGGLEIHTTLDVYLNDEVERIIQRNLDKLKLKNVTNGAVMVVKNNGEILAMVGSKDFYDSTIDGQVNVTLRKRQPGSSFKPITYLSGLQKGWTPATTILDLPTKFVTEEGTPYTPKNFDQDYHGMVTVRDALANSYNIPAVKALEFTGTSTVLNLAARMGITTLDKDSDFYGLALTLGDGEVRLYDMVQVFSVLANQGTKKPLFYLADNISNNRVGDADLRPLPETVLPPDLVYLITNILSDNTARIRSFGEESALNIKNVAAKTGTSRNFRDNWTVGYSPLFTVGVWVGNSDASSMINISGVEGAGPIFHDTVNELIKLYGNPAFEKPSNIVEKEICLPSGKLPSPACPERRKEVFIKGTEPTQTDDLWQQKNGKIVLSLPPELIPWAKKKGYPVDTAATSSNYLKIENPQNLDEFKINPNVPLGYQKITFRSFHSTDIKSVEWFVNGVSIGKGDEVMWTLKEGNFTVEVRGKDASDKISIIVAK